MQDLNRMLDDEIWRLSTSNETEVTSSLKQEKGAHCELSWRGEVIFGALLLLALLAFKVLLMIREATKQMIDEDENLPPGYQGFPIVGETVDFLKESVTGEFFTKRASKYGPIFKTKIFGYPTVYVCGKNAVTKAFYSEGKATEAAWPPSMQYLLGPQGLSSQSGRQHHQLKMRLMKSMNSRMLQETIPHLHNVMKRELHKMSTGTQPVDIRQEAKRLTVKLACLFLFGQEVANAEALSLKMGEITAGFFALPLPVPGTAFFKALQAKRFVAGRISEMLQPGHDTSELGFMPVFRDMLANTDDQRPDNLNDLAMELLLGGFETMTSVFTSIFLNLDIHPELVRVIKEELRSSEIASGDALMTYEDVSKLKKVGEAVEQTLKRYPPIGGSYKNVKREFTIEGYRIPEGWRIISSVADPLLDKDKLVSLSDMAATKDTLSFGAGPRSCVGKIYANLVLKIFTTELVNSFQWTIQKPYPKLIFVPSLRPVKPLMVALTKRV